MDRFVRRRSLVAAAAWLLASALHAQDRAVPFGKEGRHEALPAVAAQGLQRSAYVGPQPFDVQHYRLDVRLALVNEELDGRCTITLRLLAPADSLAIHAARLAIDSVRVDGLPAAARVDSLGERLVVRFPASRGAGELVTLAIDYRRPPSWKRPGSRLGYYFFRDTVGNPANLGYTMSEPSDARCWMPCYDEPWDKATAEVNVTVPAGYAAVSNGRLVGTAAGPGGVTWRWREDHQIATYLMSLTASRFAVPSQPFVRAPGDTVAIQYWVWQADSALCAAYLPTVRQMVGVYSNLFGRYPFDKYGMTAVVPFTFGGMEHQTITTMNWHYRTNEKVVVHELAHQWWGDLVTCGTWRDIWLNESFASYSEALWKESLGGPGALRAYMKTSQEHFNFASWQYAVYDPVGQRQNLFSDLVYNKGSWILHTLRGVVGDSAFFRSLRAYRAKYEGGCAVTSEFKAVVDSVAGQDLSWFFDAWVYGKGWPKYAQRTAWAADTLALTVYQMQDASWPTYRMPIRVRAWAGGRDTAFTVRDSLRTQVFRVRMSPRPDSVQLDPDNWILKQLVNPPASVADVAEPAEFALEQNYPNPFNPATTIGYRVPGPGSRAVRLSVYDILGRRVATLVDEKKPAGSHTATFDASGLASGVYFSRLTGGGAVLTRRMLLTR